MNTVLESDQPLNPCTRIWKFAFKSHSTDSTLLMWDEKWDEHRHFQPPLVSMLISDCRHRVKSSREEYGIKTGIYTEISSTCMLQLRLVADGLACQQEVERKGIRGARGACQVQPQ